MNGRETGESLSWNVRFFFFMGKTRNCFLTQNTLKMSLLRGWQFFLSNENDESIKNEMYYFFCSVLECVNFWVAWCCVWLVCDEWHGSSKVSQKKWHIGLLYANFVVKYFWWCVTTLNWTSLKQLFHLAIDISIQLSCLFPICLFFIDFALLLEFTCF